MKIFKDYLIEVQKRLGMNENHEKFGILYGAITLAVFSEISIDKVKMIEVSSEEYKTIVNFFAPHERWDGKTIWGIKLVIK